MLSVERARADKDVGEKKESKLTCFISDKKTWLYAVIKDMYSFRPECVSSEAFALQQNATAGWRG